MKSAADTNQEIAHAISNNLARLLREFSRDFEQRMYDQLVARGYTDIRPSHSAVFCNLGLGAVRVTDLAEHARVTQQAMGKMLKEVERLGYISRDIDSVDKRAKAIRLTERGIQITQDAMEAYREVWSYYADRVGARELLSLEDRLRNAVGKLELDYLPASWTGQPD